MDWGGGSAMKNDIFSVYFDIFLSIYNPGRIPGLQIPRSRIPHSRDTPRGGLNYLSESESRDWENGSGIVIFKYNIYVMFIFCQVFWHCNQQGGAPAHRLRHSFTYLYCHMELVKLYNKQSTECYLPVHLPYTYLYCHVDVVKLDNRPSNVVY